MESPVCKLCIEYTPGGWMVWEREGKVGDWGGNGGRGGGGGGAGGVEWVAETASKPLCRSFCHAQCTHTHAHACSHFESIKVLNQQM